MLLRWAGGTCKDTTAAGSTGVDDSDMSRHMNDFEPEHVRQVYRLDEERRIASSECPVVGI